MFDPRRDPVQVFRYASQALGRVDRDGMRGVIALSAQQVEAMAVLLAAYPHGLTPPAVLGAKQVEAIAVLLAYIGLVPWHPGTPEPETFVVGEVA